MRDRAIRWVIISGSLAMLAILAFQVYWISSNWKVREEAMDQQVQIALRKVAQGIADYNRSNLHTEDLIVRRSHNYYLVNVNDQIDANVLEFYMRNALNELHLPLDFEYAIYDCDKDQMVYGDYCSAEEVPAAQPSDRLPKYERFTYYFGIRFPQLRGMILGQMNVTLVMSALLLITLLFFAYALYVILSQKRFTDLQKEFINNMTHEFKTPISSIAIGAKSFLDSELIRSQPRLHKYAGIIHSQAGRLNSQVEKILDLARLEKEQFRLKREEVDVHDILERVALTNRERVEAAGGEMLLEMEAADPHVWADPLHLTNVLYNLVDNSIKYSGEHPRLELRTEDMGGALRLSVRDQGPGIERQEQGRVFDKFYRVPTGDRHDTKGFGLGLYYVKQISRLHGWDLQLRSEPGEGTTFIITMPRKRKK